MGRRSFVPGLGFQVLTPFYDAFIALTMREARFREMLLEQMDLRSVRTVADVGCGTGTLALMLKRRAPQACITGIDLDPAMITRARRKAADAGVQIRFENRHAAALPLEDGCIDLAVSTLLFHHLLDPEKSAALREIRRVLRLGGSFHLLDFGKPANPAIAASFGLLRRIDGKANTEANARGLLPSLVAAAGFSSVQRRARMNTVFGTLDFLTAF
jgi:ubiquinone/menaquinone biosynthesis C-methylase UbiE